MVRMMSVFVILALAASLCFAADVTPKTFGAAPTLKEATPISQITKEPAKFVDKDVLIAGKIVSMCQHKGCWVELEAADSSRILCKSMDESVHFSKDCLNQMAQIEGKVVYEAKKVEKTEMKSEKGEKPHACPSPKLMVSLKGGTVMFAEASKIPEVAPEPKKDGAPATAPVAPVEVKKDAPKVEEKPAPAGK
jgi:hypothetical protein